MQKSKVQQQQPQESQFKSTLKSTEELVIQARLNQIAKEHRSIGSVLDKRTLFDIEEPKKLVFNRKSKAADKSRDELENRMQMRRAAEHDGSKETGIV